MTEHPPSSPRDTTAATRPHRGAIVKLTFALAAILLAAGPAAADDNVRVRTIEKDLPAADVTAVSLHGSTGEVEVVGTGSDTVRARIVFKCRKDTAQCRSVAEDVDVSIYQDGATLKVRIEDWPKIGHRGLQTETRLEIPRDRNLEIDWGVGEMNVNGMEANIEIDNGVGEINVDTAEAAVRSVSLDTGVGEVELHAGDRRFGGHGFISHSLDWSDGPGDAHIEVDNGVGEVQVKLH